MLLFLRLLRTRGLIDLMRDHLVRKISLNKVGNSFGFSACTIEFRRKFLKPLDRFIRGLGQRRRRGTIGLFLLSGRHDGMRSVSEVRRFSNGNRHPTKVCLGADETWPIRLRTRAVWTTLFFEM